MPFRSRQKLKSFPIGSISFEVGTPNPDTGIVEFSRVKQQTKLPEVSMTDLNLLLKAGVSLEQYSCKLVNGDVHNVAEYLGTIKEEVKSNEE